MTLNGVDGTRLITWPRSSTKTFVPASRRSKRRDLHASLFVVQELSNQYLHSVTPASSLERGIEFAEEDVSGKLIK
jgi:hypothetical protein